MFRLGEIAISPGEVPALSGLTRANVSFRPLIIASPPKAKPAVTPCEAMTRSFRPLLVLVLWLPPQDRRVTLAANPTTSERMRFFKRQAPNKLKTEDLNGEWGIITDSLNDPHRRTLKPSPAFCSSKRSADVQIRLHPVFSKNIWQLTFLPGSSSPRSCATGPWGLCSMPKVSLSTGPTMS